MPAELVDSRSGVEEISHSQFTPPVVAWVRLASAERHRWIFDSSGKHARGDATRSQYLDRALDVHVVRQRQSQRSERCKGRSKSTKSVSLTELWIYQWIAEERIKRCRLRSWRKSRQLCRSLHMNTHKEDSWSRVGMSSCLRLWRESRQMCRSLHMNKCKEESWSRVRMSSCLRLWRESRPWCNHST